MKRILPLVMMMIGSSFGAEVILKDGRFVTLKVDRDNKGHVEKYQIFFT